MLCAFAGAGIGNYIRCKLSKHHYTLFLCIIVSISAACLSYSVMLKLLEICFAVKGEHEAGYICAGEDCCTSVPGIFAVGDVRTKKLRQIVTAVADGANAVNSVQEYFQTR